MSGKVLLIGIDGGTWVILQPIMEKGYMPNLKSLVDGGAWGILKSTIPPLTAPAWTTFMTGLDPGRHGIVEFNNYDGAYGTYFVTNASIKQKTIWELASEMGLRVISVNVPLTYPPFPVRGFMVTGMLTPDTSRFTYPPSLGKVILEEFGEYRIVTTGKVYVLHGLDRFFQELRKTVKLRADVVSYLLSTMEWDLAMVHFFSTDVLQHFAFHCLDPTHPHHHPPCMEKAYRFYQELDKAIGQVLEAADRRGVSLKIALSDHGFMQVHTTILLNSLLAKHGFFRPESRSLAGEVIWRLLRGMRRNFFVKFMRWFVDWEKREKSILFLRRQGKLGISESIAFSLNGGIYGNIYINLKGRQPNGIVEEKDYLRIREEIKEALKDERGVKQILLREEAFGTSNLASLPDLVVVPEKGYAFSPYLSVDRNKPYVKNYVRADYTGTHHIEGIWIVEGKGVKRGRVDAHIIDLLPTIFWYLGLAIPDYAQGRVVKEAFREEFSGSREEKRVKMDPRREPGKTYGEEGALEERLHDLGYL